MCIYKDGFLKYFELPLWKNNHFVLHWSGRWCAGTYSASDLEQCLSPSEVLQLRGGDVLRAARAARPPAVPFGCAAVLPTAQSDCAV